jgi:hypothetical protein
MATYALIHGADDSAFYIKPDEIDGGHCPALSRPRELATCLEGYREELAIQ